jgi:DNA repair protein RecO (recombination protein O)
MTGWRDEAILLAVRPLGESGRILTLFARTQGRHAGLNHGGVPQLGSRVQATWRARLAEHLGHFTVEALDQPAGRLMDQPLRLSALAAACALLDATLAEQEAHPALYEATLALFELLDGSVWDVALVRWEMGLLAELGFGLDLAACAVTGGTDDLAWVSPRTGRAISAAAGEPWRDRLLKLPGFLAGQGTAAEADVLDGLALTGHFLERHLLAQGRRALPDARTRFVDAYRRAATRSGRIPAS